MAVESGLTGEIGEDPVTSFTEPPSCVADKTHALRMVRKPRLLPASMTASCKLGKGPFPLGGHTHAKAYSLESGRWVESQSLQTTSIEHPCVVNSRHNPVDQPYRE